MRFLPNSPKTKNFQIRFRDIVLTKYRFRLTAYNYNRTKISLITASPEYSNSKDESIKRMNKMHVPYVEFEKKRTRIELDKSFPTMLVPDIFCGQITVKDTPLSAEKNIRFVKESHKMAASSHSFR